MRKLAIVNGAPSSEMDAPFTDPEYDIWVLGNRINRYPLEHVDLIFEIHDDCTEQGGDEYLEYLASLNLPLVVGEYAYNYLDEYNWVGLFDFDASREYFGSTYLTSSTVYMLSEAARRGYEHIELYGVDMAVDEHEYFMQRPCLEAWVGFLRGKGITVEISPKSPVCRSDYVEGKGCGGVPDFSVEPFTSASFQAIIAKHQASISQANAEIEALRVKINTHHGAIQAYDRMRKVARAIEMGQKVENIEKEAVVK